ncbi:MAG: Rpn family recombination-promoting nuclease/putative transposase [Planctomycetaceae bacterium]|nr:Rpn family recombination-promoting nuclease/putative transposase [Planctomycetaceae bacterium]
MSYDDLIPKPTSDLFTAVLWSAPKNEPILRSFINAVLTDIGMTPIVKATVLNPFNIKEFAANKAIILDVRVKDEYERLYDIEVQVIHHAAFANRVLHYWSDAYASQLRIGNDYTELRPVISIVLTEFPVFPQLKNLHHVFQITAKENSEFLLTNHLQIHFVRLSDLLKGHWEKLEGIRRELRHWVNFFVFAAMKTEEEMSGLVDNDPIIRAAYEELQRFYANDELREKIRERQQFLIDYQLGLNSARQEGLTEGEAKGIEKGIEKERVDSLLRILLKRFEFLPEGVQKKLRTIHDLDVLAQLTDFALDCKTLDEFVKKL